MKFILYLFIIISVIELRAQANQQLSNLSGAVAINKSLVPGSVYSILDLGNSDNAWRSIYTGSSDVDSISNNIMYYTGNIFMHNNGGATTGNSEGLYVGEFAGNQASSDNNGCVGIGFSALKSMDVGNHNTGLGWRSLLNLNGMSGGQGDKNTMIGSKSGESISTGSENTGVGWNVFYKGTAGDVITGSSNVGIGGNNVLGLITSGSYNTALGHSAGQKINTGTNNIIIGYNSGSDGTMGIQDGSYNILIGNGVNTTASNSTYQLNIGNTLYGNVNTIRIGIGSSNLSSMFNVGSSDQFQVNSSGKIPKYGSTTPTNGLLLIGNTSTSQFETGTLTGGSGINTTNGAGTISIDMDINELTAETDIAVAEDYIPFYDASEAANNKLNIETLLAQYITTYRKNRFDYYNEFINGVSTGSGGNDIIASSNGSGASSSATSATSVTNVVGLVRSQTGTDIDGRTSCATYNSAVLLGGGQWMYELRINGIAALSDASGGTEIYQLLVGFYDVNSAQNQTDGVYFLYDRAGVSAGSTASANWQLVNSSNATRSFTTSSSAVATGVTTLKIFINAAGTSAEFFINDTSVGTQTTNIPTGTNRATGFGWMLIKSAGTTNRAMETDYLSVQCDYTTSK